MAIQAPRQMDKDALDAYVRDPRFTQVFDFSPDESQARPGRPFRVTYADYGYRNQAQPELEHVLLFFAPLLGSRMLYVALDGLAKRHNVRIINPDRPGFGETTDARAEERLSFWRGAVIALLRHLDIRHVSIGTQSGGTVYALDLLLHHPEILHPDRPYIGIGAPWIDPDRSGCRLMAVTQSLPRVLIEQTDKLASLVSTVSAPIMSTSFGLAGVFVAPTSGPSVDPEVAFEEALRPRNMKFVYSGAVHGLSQDAVLLMKRTESTSGWGDWGDYDELIPRLAEKLRPNRQPLRVEVFLGESDLMIGNPGSKGPEWFNACWERARQDGDDSPIQFSSSVVQGADHDTVWDLKWGTVQRVFQEVGRPG
ncbi:hypothetical protein E4U41_002671 [Claviceps citrina]|nr:hypothetical protein E4U41_002671 [Claviceps citrina]